MSSIVCPSVCLPSSVSSSIISLSICIYNCLSVCLSVCLSTIDCLSVCLSVYDRLCVIYHLCLSINLSMCLSESSIILSVCLGLCVIYSLSVCLSISLPVYMSFCFWSLKAGHYSLREEQCEIHLNSVTIKARKPCRFEKTRGWVNNHPSKISCVHQKKGEPNLSSEWHVYGWIFKGSVGWILSAGKNVFKANYKKTEEVLLGFL